MRFRDRFGKPRMRPIIAGMLAAFVLLSASACVATVLYLLGSNAVTQEVQQGLIRSAKAAATRVDPRVHLTLESPDAHESPEYEQAVAKLREIRDSDAEIAYIYTCILIGDQVHFVLDAAEPGDSDEDGIDDKSYPLEHYPEASPELLRALASGLASADSRPYRDRWGTFMSAYAPVFDANGDVACVVGVDLTVEDFVGRLAGIRTAWYIGLALAMAIALLAGVATFIGFGRIARAEAEAARSFEIISAQKEVLEMVARNAPLDEVLESIALIAAEHLPGSTWHIYPSETAPGHEGAWLRAPVWDRSGAVVGWVVTTGEGVPPDMNLLGHLEAIVVQLSAIAIDRAHSDKELSTARDEALNASRLKSAFLATMSHEIRTPMNGIIGMSEILLSTSLDERQLECLNTIRESADLLVGMINDILDHSKLEANAIRIEEMEFDLNELVEGATSLLAPAAHQKGLELVCEVPVDVNRLLLGDPLRLRQVLLNLLGNAIKFTESGEIWVETRLEETAIGGATLELSVHDTGIGIPVDRLVSVFDSFSQADASTTRRFGGTGLGLTISKQLIECMGGTLEVQSSVGEGTSFFARVPVHWGTANADATKDAFGTSGLCAAVIWKNAQGRSIVRKYLSAMGVVVSDAASVAAYIERYGCLPIEALVIADGEVIAEFQESYDISARKIVALLPLSSDRSVVDHLNARVVWKPVRFDDLRQAISSFAPTLADRAHQVPADLGFEELHVLVADDNRTNRRVAGHMLERLGHTVEFAENGEEAVELAATGRFDLVFMDIEMPVMDGLEAMRRIRASGIGPALPIYAMTAHDQAVTRELNGGVGFDGAFIKPVRGDRLAEIITRVSMFKAQQNSAA